MTSKKPISGWKTPAVGSMNVGLAGGTLYRCGTIGMKKFALVEMWKKYLHSVREMDGMKRNKIGSEWLGEGTG